MKIGILTQPIKINYGGILQAYALQKVLKDNGHDVWIINRHSRPSQNYFFRKWIIYKYILKQIACFCLRRQSYAKLYLNIKSVLEITLSFSKKYIQPCSNVLYTDRDLKKFVCKQKFEVYIVGSDQVWRPCYSPNIYTYFLDFVPKSSNVKKIAYAASFGVDNWEFSEEETNKCSDLLKYFNYVSCREVSGVSMCRDYLKRNDAEWVLDPTFLLSSEVYLSLIEKAYLGVTKKKFLVSYILDETTEKNNIIKFISEKLKCPIHNSKKGFSELQNRHVKDKATVEEWLYGFSNADFAVTDSFHGCVFSIIFHTPFLIIRNKNRGNARFDSLINLFNLEGRVLDSVSGIDDSHIMKMNWAKIDCILKRERQKSLCFLLNSLNN